MKRIIVLLSLMACGEGRLSPQGGTITGATTGGGLVVTSGKLGLITTCADGELLTWNDGGSVWECNSAGGGSVTGTGTSGNYTKFTGTGTVGNATATEPAAGTFMVGANGPYLTDVSELNFNRGDNIAAIGYINGKGYNGGTTQFRSLYVQDGKGANICTFTGSTKVLNCIGGIQVNGTAVPAATGTINTLAMFTGTSILGDSPLVYNGTQTLTWTKADAGSHANRPIVAITNSTTTGSFGHRAELQFNIYDASNVSRQTAIVAEGSALSINTPSGDTTISNGFVVNGATTWGDSPTNDSHTLNGYVAQNTTPSGSTASNVGYDLVKTGTFNTTGGALTSGGMNVSVTTTRSSGASDLTNRAIYASASGAQTNYAIYTNLGDVYVNQGGGEFVANGNVTLGDNPADLVSINGSLGVVNGISVNTFSNYDTSGGINITAFNASFVAARDITLDGERIYIGDTGNGTLSLKGALETNTELTPAQITSDQNNYNPTGWSYETVVFVNSDAARNITGFDSSTVPYGRHVWLYNNGSFNITLKHQSASSSAGNKIQGRGGADTVLAPSTGVHLYYSNTSTQWVVLSDTL